MVKTKTGEQVHSSPVSDPISNKKNSGSAIASSSELKVKKRETQKIKNSPPKEIHKSDKKEEKRDFSAIEENSSIAQGVKGIEPRLRKKENDSRLNSEHKTQADIPEMNLSYLYNDDDDFRLKDPGEIPRDIDYKSIPYANDGKINKLLMADSWEILPETRKAMFTKLSFFVLKNMRFLHELQYNNSFIQDLLKKDTNSSSITLLTEIIANIQSANKNLNKIKELLKSEQKSVFYESAISITKKSDCVLENLHEIIQDIKLGHISSHEDLIQKISHTMLFYDDLCKETIDLLHSDEQLQKDMMIISDNEREIDKIKTEHQDSHYSPESLAVDNIYYLLNKNKDSHEIKKVMELMIYMENILSKQWTHYMLLKDELTDSVKERRELSGIHTLSEMASKINPIFNAIDKIVSDYFKEKEVNYMNHVLISKKLELTIAHFSFEPLIEIYNKNGQSAKLFKEMINQFDSLYNNNLQSNVSMYKALIYYFSNANIENKELLNSLQKDGYIPKEYSIEFLMNSTIPKKEEIAKIIIGNICKRFGFDEYKDN